MTGGLDELLRRANTDAAGNVALAHLRRRKQARWDLLVVARDNMPLMFWSPATEAPEGALWDDRGNVLSVLVSTPPGVEPAGLLSVPADESGSPIVDMVSVVGSEGATLLESLGASPSGEPVDAGIVVIQSLIEAYAWQTGGGYHTVNLESADGDETTVLVDWDGRPLMCWLASLDEAEKRDVFFIAATDAGFAACVSDEVLRPKWSNEQLASLLVSPDAHEQRNHGASGNQGTSGPKRSWPWQRKRIRE
jgi:hypothetical protein